MEPSTAVNLERRLHLKANKSYAVSPIMQDKCFYDVNVSMDHLQIQQNYRSLGRA